MFVTILSVQQANTQGFKIWRHVHQEIVEHLDVWAFGLEQVNQIENISKVVPVKTPTVRYL